MSVRPSYYLDKPRKAFGDANGWTYRDTYFNIGQLARNSSRKTRDEYWHPHGYWNDGFDHSEFYYLDKKPVAIATHPYPGRHIKLQEVRKIWQIWPRLQVHECPDIKASWYYPGSTLLFVVTRIGTNVVWPTPEEVEQSVLRHQEEYKRQIAQATAFKKRRDEIAKRHELGD